MGRHAVAVEIGALLVDLRLGAHHDAGNAEAALQAATGGEGGGVPITLGVAEAFQVATSPPGDLVE